MLEELHACLQRGENRAFLGSGPLMPEYQKALFLFWEGDYEASCIEISRALSEYQEEHPHILNLYRLWIEILIIKEDYPSLDALKHHLLLRWRESDSLKQSFRALRMLIHLERDEWEPINLWQKHQENMTHCAYSLEVLEIIAFRRGEISFPLLNSKAGLSDYLQVVTIAKHFAILDQVEMISTLEKSGLAWFPKSPLFSEIRLSKAIDEKNFSEAIAILQRLCIEFPLHREYQFQLGYCQFFNKQYAGAYDIFNQLVQLKEYQNDVDILRLLALCLAKLSDDQSDLNINAAIQAFKDAKRELNLQGFPIIDVEMSLYDLKKFSHHIDESTPHFTELDPPKGYIVKVSQSKYLSLTNRRAEDCENLVWPIGSDVSSDDVIFLAADDIKPNHLRLFAVYMVSVGSTPDTLKKHLCSMQLVKRLVKAVSLSTAELRIENKQGDRFSDLEVFAIEPEALSSITEEIKQLQEFNTENVLIKKPS